MTGAKKARQVTTNSTIMVTTAALFFRSFRQLSSRKESGRGSSGSASAWSGRYFTKALSGMEETADWIVSLYAITVPPLPGRAGR